MSQQIIELGPTAANAEILAARHTTELALAAFDSVLSDQAKQNRVIQGVLEAIDTEVHWHSYVMVDLLQKAKVYRELAELRTEAASDANLNPSLVNPQQSPQLLSKTRHQNLNFINRLQALPEMTNLSHQIDQAQLDETDLDQQQVETMAIGALIDRLTPTEFKLRGSQKLAS